jgi:hypothetical protein
MENTRQFNPDLAAISRSALLIAKVHNCADCPIRRLATSRPRSIFARIHNWHRTWWPGWKAHQAKTCPFATRAGTQA